MINEIIHIPTLPAVITPIPRLPDQNPAMVYLASLPAKSGRNTQAQVIKVMAALLGGSIHTIEWGRLRYAHTIALKTRILDAGYSPASARKFLCAIRGTLKAARKLGQISAEECANAIDLGRVGGTSLPAGRLVLDEEIAKIFHVCLEDPKPTGPRDAALFAILFGCGLRREEIVNLDFADYRPAEQALTVHGKRGKDRIAYVVNGTAEALNDWITVRGVAPGPLFLAVSQSGVIRQEHRLSPQAVYNVIYKRLGQAGLEKFSPHSLRRSFCSRLLDAGVDIAVVSKLAGHSNIQTTALYDRRGETSKRAGALLVEIPYKKGGGA